MWYLIKHNTLVYIFVFSPPLCWQFYQWHQENLIFGHSRWKGVNKTSHIIVFSRVWTPSSISLSSRWRTLALNNGNWTEWSAIWAEIIRVISKLNERAVRVQFEITSMISDQNCTTRGSITTLLHPFWNRPNTGLDQFRYSINAVLSWFEIKFIHCFGGKIRVVETKVAKFVIWYFVFYFPAIWLVSLNKPWNLIGCFVISVASLAGKSMQFKFKKWCNSWMNHIN